MLLALGGCADDGGIGPGNESSSGGSTSTSVGLVTTVSPGTTSTATNADTTAGAASSSSGGVTTVGASTSSGGATTGTTGMMTTTGGTTVGTTTEGTSGTTGSSSTSSGGGPGCGNGAVEPGEQCDGADLQGFDCALLGLGGGVLACDPVMCTFDTSGCMPIGNCGNGVIDPGEQCDGADLQGFDCFSLGLGGGVLACDPVMCTFDTSMCMGGGGTSG
jgi:hypothetical protein